MFYVVVDGFRGSRKSFPSIEEARRRALELFDAAEGERAVRIVEVIQEITPVQRRRRAVAAEA